MEGIERFSRGDVDDTTRKGGSLEYQTYKLHILWYEQNRVAPWRSNGMGLLGSIVTGRGAAEVPGVSSKLLLLTWSRFSEDHSWCKHCICQHHCDDPKQPEGHGARGIWANRQGSAASGKCLQPLARRAPVITRWLTYVQISPNRGQGSSLGERPGIEGRRSQNGRCKVFVYCTSLNPYILWKTLDTAVYILKVI